MARTDANYFNVIVAKPAISAAKRWKDFLFCLAIEGAFIYATVVVLTLLFRNLTNALLKLDSSGAAGAAQIMDSAQRTSEAGIAASTILFESLFFLAIFFVMYTLTRAIIWKIATRQRFSIWKMLKIDLLFYIIIGVSTYLMLQYIVLQYYPYFYVIYFAPLFYLSFMLHMNYDRESLKESLSSTLDASLLFMLPYAIAVFAIGVFMPKYAWTWIAYLAFLNFFRLFVYESLQNARRGISS